MLLIAVVLLIAWLLSRKWLVNLVPSESLLALMLVGMAVVVLFQIGELG